MKILSLFIGLTLLAGISAHADFFGFSAVTTNAPQRDAVANQLFMDVTTWDAAHSGILFTNTGPMSSSISEIYIGSALTTLDLTIDSVVNSSPGVKYDISGSSPFNPPGWEDFGSWWTVTIAAAESEPPPSSKGVNPYEFLELGISYDSVSSFSELLQSGEVQVAMHVISIGEYSDTFQNGTNTLTVIPEPTSLLLIGISGTLIAFVRRRLVS